MLISGMHRSGTSMIARLLHQCGVYLGEQNDLIPPADDNPEGFWEHAQFRELNEEILETFGGNWDFPPVLEAGWEKKDYLNLIRPRVVGLINQFSGQRIWGWKDPRNSLTLPYWKMFFPKIKVVICLRNPHDVYLSLERRGYSSSSFSYNLWLTYYNRLVAALDAGTFIVTHFESYFYNPKAEVSRVLNFLGVECSNEVIEQACLVVSPGLRNNHSSVSDLVASGASIDLLRMYKNLCRQAGEIFYLSLTDEERELLENVVSDKDLTITDYQNVIRLLRDELAQKINQINSLAELSQNEIVRLKNELNNIYKSRSWKLVQKLQTIKAFFVRG